MQPVLVHAGAGVGLCCRDGVVEGCRLLKKGSIGAAVMLVRRGEGDGVGQEWTEHTFVSSSSRLFATEAMLPAMNAARGEGSRLGRCGFKR